MSSLCPGFPRREQKRRGLETCLGTVSPGALGASGEPTKAGGRSAEPRELRRRGQGCGIGQELPKAQRGCTPQSARGHSSGPHTDMETRRGAVPAAGEQRGPGPGPCTGQGGGGEGREGTTGEQLPEGGNGRRPRGAGAAPSRAPRGPALPLSRAGRRGPHGSRRRDRAAAGGAAGAARAPRQTHPEDGGDRLLLRGPRCGWMVQGAGPARPGGHESRGREEDGPGPGRVCTMLPRMLPRHHRGRERSVCGGKLVQDPAGLRGCPAHQLLCKCWREVKATSVPPSPRCRAGSAHQRGSRAGLLRVPSGHPVPCLRAAVGSGECPEHGQRLAEGGVGLVVPGHGCSPPLLLLLCPDLATGADCQLLLRPSEPQAGGCPVRGHCLELLPLLESKSGVRGEAVSRGCPRSLSAS